MRYPLGQDIYLATTVVNGLGVLTDDATISLTITNPDLTTQNFASPTHASTGNYNQTVPTASITQTGHYLFVWNSHVQVTHGEFDVFNPTEPAILSLADAKDAANVAATTLTYDEKILGMVDTITSMIEVITGGPAYNRTITNERVRLTGNLTSIVLRYRPLVSVTSVVSVSDGTSLSLADLDPDYNTGILRRKMGWPFILWRGIAVDVTYVAGWGTAIPAAFSQAARIILQHLWQTQRGPSAKPLTGMEATLLPGMDVAIPDMALEMLDPYSQQAYV